MIRIYWAEIRRSPLRWWLPLLIAIDLATLFGRHRYWIGIWPQASAAAQIPSMFLGPALAGAAAWAAAARSRQPGLGDRFSSSIRPPWQLEAVQLASSLCYGIVAYGVGVVAAAAASLPEAGPGFLWPGYLLLGLTVVVISTAVGHATGRLLRSTVLAPALAATGVLVLMNIVDSLYSLGLLVLSGHPQKTVSAPAISARLIFAGALTVAAIMLPPLVRRGVRTWRSSRKSVGTALLTTAALLGTIPIWAMSGPPTVPRPVPARPLCSQGTSTVCVWPEDRKYLPQLSAMVGRLASLPTDLFTVSTTFYEQGLRPGPEPGVYTYEDFFIIEGSPWSVSSTMASRVYNDTFDSACIPDDDHSEADRRILRATREVISWLEVRAVGPDFAPDFREDNPYADTNQIYKMVNAPEAEQLAWIRERVKILRDARC